MKMNKRMVKRDGIPVRIMYYPATQMICDCDTLVSKIDGKVLDGPGCAKCDPDKGVDMITLSDHSYEADIRRMLVMEDEEFDPFDEIEPDFIELDPEDADIELKDEIDDELVECLRQIEHHEFMRKLDPVIESKDAYKTVYIPHQVFQNADRVL